MNTRRLVGLTSSVLLVMITACSDITKPNMPLVVTFRESLVGHGIVAQFYNQTNHQLTVYLVLENKEKNHRKKMSVNIPADDMVEIGWLEGWMFESGETITISHPNYKTSTWRVP
jgi:hypothetical protein